ncbi:MAG: cation diffusion facilitator family transporter [Alphaproteobacteria bacterium]|nr:MAG: cation diffusion facilitator family transporter [Alphaproteobacteria bacterium]
MGEPGIKDKDTARRLAASGWRLDVSAGAASVGVATALVLLKLWAFWRTGSLSVAASLADSALDVVVSIGALVAIVYSRKPADDDHAFGHGSAEDLSALAQSAFILLAAGGIAASALRRLLGDSPARITHEGAGLAVMAISLALTLALVWWQRRVARRTGSRIVAADSLHYLGDLGPGIGAVLSLFASAWFGISTIDSVVALASAAFMAVGALRVGRGAWDALMDRSADPSVVEAIRKIAAEYPGVRGFHDLRTRTAGRTVFVNIHVELDGDQSLEAAHDIAAGLKRAIIARVPNADVIIHKDPVRRPSAPGKPAPGK